MTDPAPIPLDTLLAHRPFVTALARALVRNASAADDLAQEAWLVATTRPPSSVVSIRGWFARVLRNAARDAWRSDARRARRERAAVAPPPVPKPDDVVARGEIHRRVVQAVMALDEPYRRTILLRFFEGLETPEIAARDGVSQATVRKRLERALGRLRARLDEESDGDRRRWIAALLPFGATEFPDDASRRSSDKSPSAGRSGGFRRLQRIGVACAVVVGLVVAAAILRQGSTRRDVNVGDRQIAVPIDDDVAASMRPLDNSSDAPAARAADGARGAPAAPPPMAVSLAAPRRVEVVSPTGESVAGATVAVHHCRFTNEMTSYSEDLPEGEPWKPDGSFATGVDGIAVVSGLRTGDYTIVAEAPPYAGSRATQIGLREKEGAPIRLLLRRAGAVRGRVVDAGTGATVDAEVAFLPDSEFLEPRGLGRRRTRTDSSGRFKLEGIPATTGRICARRPGRATAVALPADSASDVHVVLRMPGAVDLRGVAMDVSKDRPAAGAALDVVIDCGSGSATRVRVVTASDGTFAVDEVPQSARLSIVPWEPGRWSLRSNDLVLRPEAVDASKRVRVDLVPKATVTGVVTGLDGGPADGAEILVVGDRYAPHSHSVGTLLGRVRADTNGVYRFENLGPGRIQVFARLGEGICPASPIDGKKWWDLAMHPPADDPRVEVVAGRSFRVDLRLVPGRHVSGRVLWPDGKPGASARVAIADRHIGGDWAAATTSDEDGRFELRGVPWPEEVLVVSAHLHGSQGKASLAPGMESIEVRLTEQDPYARPVPVSISGRVTRGDGTPVAGVTLYVDPQGPGSIEELRPTPGSSAFEVPVRRDGSFQVDGIDARDGHVDLIATAPGLPPVVERVSVAPGGRADDVHLVLDEGVLVRGRLLDDAGGPAAGIAVRVAKVPLGNTGFDGSPPVSETTVDGTFQFRVAAGSTLCISFGAGEEVLHSLPAHVLDAEPFEVRLPADAAQRALRRHSQPDRITPPSLQRPPPAKVALEGRVTDTDGRPLPHARLRFVSDRGPTWGAADDKGQFSIDVRVGETGFLEADAGDAGTTRVEGVGGGSAPLEVRVQPRASPILRGVVRDERGGPVANAPVILLRAERWLNRAALSVDPERPEGRSLTEFERRFLRAEADGSFVVRTLPIGRWVVFAGFDGTPWAPTSFTTVETTHECTVDPAVRRGRTLRVRILDADGKPRPFARVEIASKAPTESQLSQFHMVAVTDSHGRLEHVGMPNGACTIRINTPAESRSAEVQPSDDLVDVKL